MSKRHLPLFLCAILLTACASPVQPARAPAKAATLDDIRLGVTTCPEAAAMLHAEVNVQHNPNGPDIAVGTLRPPKGSVTGVIEASFSCEAPRWVVEHIL